MAVNKNIGFFHQLVQTTRSLASKNYIGPVRPIILQTTDYNSMKKLANIKDSEGSSKTFHWGSHLWGDADNLVGE